MVFFDVMTHQIERAMTAGVGGGGGSWFGLLGRRAASTNISNNISNNNNSNNNNNNNNNESATTSTASIGDEFVNYLENTLLENDVVAALANEHAESANKAKKAPAEPL